MPNFSGKGERDFRAFDEESSQRSLTLAVRREFATVGQTVCNRDS